MEADVSLKNPPLKRKFSSFLFPAYFMEIEPGIFLSWVGVCGVRLDVPPETVNVGGVGMVVGVSGVRERHVKNKVLGGTAKGLGGVGQTDGRYGERL